MKTFFYATDASVLSKNNYIYIKRYRKKVPIRDSLPLFTFLKEELLILRGSYNAMLLKVIKTKSKIYTKCIKRESTCNIRKQSKCKQQCARRQRHWSITSFALFFSFSFLSLHHVTEITFTRHFLLLMEATKKQCVCYSPKWAIIWRVWIPKGTRPRNKHFKYNWVLPLCKIINLLCKNPTERFQCLT